jgi:photosystem II stability/assembly factor-like uncharacterized protein
MKEAYALRNNLQFILMSAVLLLVASSCRAQDRPASSKDPNQASASQMAATSGGVTTAEQTGSPDIPPFAWGLIDEETYLQLRDGLTAIKRGLPDLLLDRGARSRAIRQLEQQEGSLLSLQAEAKRLAGKTGAVVVSAPAWTSLGPAPIPNGQTDPLFVNELPVSGRVSAIAVDPIDANTVYVGTAQGGLYRTQNGGTTWTALMDSALSLAIGTITINPLDHNIVFVGTGEANISSMSFFGVGLYIIRGATQATPTLSGPFNSDGTNDVFTGRSISQILVNPSNGNGNNILVSTVAGYSGMSGDTSQKLPTRGVYRSTNALSATPTFQRQTIQTAEADRDVTDMAMDPDKVGTIVVNVYGTTVAGDGGIWVSTSGDPWAGTATWTPTVSKAAVAKLAVNRSGATPATTFFATFAEQVPCTPSGGAPIKVNGTMSQSTNGGVDWVPVPAATGFCGDQCNFDMSVAIAPDNVMNILIGGSAPPDPPVQTDGSAPPDPPAPITIGNCGTGVMGRSTDGGKTFKPSQNYLHADSHATAYAPRNTSVIYAGNDGGIFVSSNAGATWQSLNTAGFNATQFESLSLHPTDPNFMIGGTQDNGTEFMKPDGTWTRADYGDGGFSGIDQGSTDVTSVVMYHTYFNVRNQDPTKSVIGFARVSYPADATETNWNSFGCGSAKAGNNGITCTDSVLFYAPLALGPGSPNTVYFGTDHLYRSMDRGVTNVAVSQAPLMTIPCVPPVAQPCPVRVSAIGISAQDDNVRIVGLENGHVFATAAGSNTLLDVTGAWTANMYIARAVIDPSNKDTAYITLDGYGTPNHVWKTTNLSGVPPSWAAMSSGIPDVPVNAFAVDPGNSNYLYAGSDIGSFSSTDGGLTWNPYGTGLPRVAIFDLNIQPVSHKIRVGTHGRGAWEIAAAQFNSTAGLTADSSSPDFGSNATFTATLNGTPASKIPTGTVTFMDGTTNLGSGTIDTTGKATLQTSALAVGPHTVTAVYAGDNYFLTSTSPAATINVGDYTLSVDRTAATVIAGNSATFALTVTPQGGFANPVVLSCSGLPLLSTCSFSPPTVTPNGGAAPSTLTITTTAHTTKTAMLSNPWGGAGSVFAAFTGFAFLGMVTGGGTTGKKRPRRYCLRLLVTLGLLAAIVGCGSSPTPDPATGTPAGMSNVVVTSTSGPLTQTTSIAFSVR